MSPWIKLSEELPYEGQKILLVENRKRASFVMKIRGLEQMAHP
jgi:hypothetical protein